MKKDSYKVLGVMSGTSLDGIDLAECFFSVSETGWSYQLGIAETIPYSQAWKKRLKEAIAYSEEKLQQLNIDYTHHISEVITGFILSHGIANLDAVCSHGHTILHRPDEGVTLQIGNLPELARLTGQKVICDFRVQDVLLGGQGAPLVPIGDRLLFGNYDYCLNLGGFANCSFELDRRRIAYDICPVNIVLNRYAEKLGHPFDDKGKLASEGEMDSELLERMNALSFYSDSPPKSLGLEWVQEYIFPLLKASAISEENILHTFTEHVAMQLAKQFEEGSRVLVTGGGAYNEYLLERVASFKNVTLNVPDKVLLEFKEALVFGLLGVLKLRNEINCLASVTGAERDHCSGVIFSG